MKKAPSTILATAGITAGLLGFALPAGAAVPMAQHHSNSGPSWKISGGNKNNKKKQTLPRNCPPPNRGQKQHQGHNRPGPLAESPNNQTMTTGKTTPLQWQKPPRAIACHPAPRPQHGKGKKNNKGHGKQPK